MLMRTAEYVDFSTVEDRHRSIDARLENWARWSRNPVAAGGCPMFRLYRSSEVHRVESSASQPVDGIDAARMQKGMQGLPVNHRLALSWAYIKRNNPGQAARSLGLSLQGLLDIVRDGRQMLVNSRV